MVHRSVGGRLRLYRFFFLTPSFDASRTNRTANRLYRLFGSISSALGLLFTPTFAGYAARYPSVSARTLAKRRVEAMYAALCALDCPPAGLPAMVGEVIDQHVPLITARPRCETIFAVYRRGLCPDKPVPTANTLRGVGRIVADLWSRCADHGSLRRLLLKGGPFPTSVRYVSAQLSRTAAQPDTAEAVTKLLRLSLLGAYSHARVIAPPRVRCTILSKNGAGLLAYFGRGANRTSHHYFYLVAEFVMAATRMSPSLWHWVLSHHRYAEYERLVSAAGDMIRSNSKPSRISTAIAPRAWDPPASMVGFIANAGGNKKLAVAAQRRLTPIETATVFRDAFESSRWGYAADVVALRPDSVALRSVAGAATDAAMRKALSELGPRDRALVQIVAQACSAKQSVTVSAVSGEMRALQQAAVQRRTNSTAHCVIVCTCCATWRSKSLVTGIGRGGVGVKVLLPMGRGVVCNSCSQSFGIRVLNLVGVVLRIRPRMDAPPVQVSICTHCGGPASGLRRRGAEWLCGECAPLPSATGVISSACFVCKTAPASYSFVARYNGAAMQFRACASHNPSFRGVENVAIDAVCRMVLKRRRSYIRGRR